MPKFLILLALLSGPAPQPRHDLTIRWSGANGGESIDVSIGGHPSNPCAFPSTCSYEMPDGTAFALVAHDGSGRFVTFSGLGRCDSSSCGGTMAPGGVSVVATYAHR